MLFGQSILATMGLEIQLQDECGNRIESVSDPQNLLPTLLPLDAQNRLYPMLESIDLYGDAVFNRRRWYRKSTDWYAYVPMKDICT
jgi:hypothetical protein